jgi:hypothetical protein
MHLVNYQFSIINMHILYAECADISPCLRHNTALKNLQSSIGSRQQKRRFLFHIFTANSLLQTANFN